MLDEWSWEDPADNTVYKFTVAAEEDGEVYFLDVFPALPKTRAQEIFDEHYTSIYEHFHAYCRDYST